MGLTFLHRLLIAGTATQLFFDILGLSALLVPIDSDAKRTVVLMVLVVTLIWDVAILAYLHWTPVAVPVPAGGAPPPAHHLDRGAIKGGIFSATFALLFALVALLALVVNLGLGYIATLIVVGVFLLLTTIQDSWTAIAVLRR